MHYNKFSQFKCFSSEKLNTFFFFFFSLNCKGRTFIFLWALLFLLVTVAGISSLVSNDFSVLRKTDDLLDVRGHLKHFQLSIFNNCSFFDLFSFFLPVLLFPLLQLTRTFSPLPSSLCPSALLLCIFYMFWLHHHIRPVSVGAIDCCWVSSPALVLVPLDFLREHLWVCMYPLRIDEIADCVWGKYMFLNSQRNFLNLWLRFTLGFLGCHKYNLHFLPLSTVNADSVCHFTGFTLLGSESQKRKLFK